MGRTTQRAVLGAQWAGCLELSGQCLPNMMKRWVPFPAWGCRVVFQVLGRLKDQEFKVILDPIGSLTMASLGYMRLGLK